MKSYRSILIAGVVAGVVISAPFAFSFPADDLLARAARQMREKDFGEAFTLASKGAESPRRSFLMGMAALRQGNAEQALPLLAEAEKKLPLVAEYAAFYQLEGLFKLKRYTESATRAAALLKSYPQSPLVRRIEKLQVDSLFEAGEYAAALKPLQAFVEKHPSGTDSVDALFLSARCREATGDKSGASQVYRSIWLNNPTAPQAAKSQERLRELEKEGIKPPPYSAEELLKRSATLYSKNEFTQAVSTLQNISTAGQPATLAGRVRLKSGMAQYRLRNWKQAENEFAIAAGQQDKALRSEARFWLAKALERQEHSDKAYAAYQELAAEGKGQEFADDALMQAAGMRRSHGAFAEAARLYEQLVTAFPDSTFVIKAKWEAAWSRYLNREYLLAAEGFTGLLKDENHREKALYWLGRALEQAGSKDAAYWFQKLLEEYPAGFYASWYRDQRGIADSREGVGNRAVLTEVSLPGGYDKPLLLASLGLMEDARAEMTAARKKNGERKGQLSAMARLYLEMEDYNGSISLYQQNRPLPWDKSNLPLWVAGYPRPYADLMTTHAATNSLSEGMVYALTRAESTFNPVIKSHAGAIGLMQLMPETARQTAREKNGFDAQRLTDPAYNIKLGTKHLKELMTRYDGNFVYAVASYNAGANAVERWRKNLKGLKLDEFVESIPYQETRDYVKKVYASAAIYRALYGIK